jgi:FkbM family methyltransferase
VEAEIFTHHPLFHEFRPFEGWVAGGFEPSYFGTMFRDWLFTGQSKGFTSGRQESVGYPPLNEEYFEWISLLAAVATGKDRFRMFELGAGWGRWSVSGAMLCRQRELPFHLVAIEPEPSHFEWLQMNFRDNGLDPAAHHLQKAAIARRGGRVWFAGKDDPKHEYGHYVPLGMGDLIRMVRGRFRSWKVDAVALGALLAQYPTVDLIDLDIQGMEYDALASVSPEQLRAVRLIHIETHTRTIEVRLKRLFDAMGWRNRFCFPCDSETRTPYGMVKFQGGVQTWINPECQDLLERI